MDMWDIIGIRWNRAGRRRRADCDRIDMVGSDCRVLNEWIEVS